MKKYAKLLLSVFPVLAFSLGFSLNIAQGETNANLMPLDAQTIQSLQIAGRKGKRRRGDCGIPPNAWTINFCEGGHFCYVTPKLVTLWLPEDKRSGRRVDRIKIKNMQTNQSVKQKWPASQASLSWPVNDMPIQTGTRYQIRLKKNPQPFSQEIILHQIAAQSVDEQIFEMRQKGCELQADLLEEQKG